MLTNNLKKIWKNSNYNPPPKIFFGICNNQIFATSHDDKSILFFVDEFEQVFAVPKSKCIINTSQNGDQYYEINGNYFQRVSCRKPFREKDVFTYENIIPQLINK